MAKQSIKQKIPFKLLAVFGLLAAIILIGGWLFYKSQRAATTRHIQSDLNTIALMKSEEITTWRRERYGNAYLLSSSRNFVEFVRKWFANPSDQVMKNNVSGRLNAFKVFNSYETVILVDSENKFRMNDDPTIKVDKLGAQTRSYIDSAAKSREIIFSDFYYCPDCRHDHLDIFAPLFDGKAYVGCLIFRVNPHVFLYPLIQSWPTDSRSGETLLLHLHRKDNVVHILNELRFQKEAGIKKQLPATDTLLVEIIAIREKTGMVEGHDYRGVPVLASIKHIENSPWYMVAKIDQSEVYAPLYRQERNMAFMILLLLSLLGLILGMLWQADRRGFYKRQYQMELDKQALIRHYDYLTKYANDIIFLLDQDRRIVEINDRGVQTYGYSREELLGREAGIIRAEDQREEFRAKMMELKAKGALLYETMHRRKDGSTFPVEVSARTIDIEGKKYLQGIVRDITERKQYELDLQERKEELEAANQELVASEEELKAADEELRHNMEELAISHTRFAELFKGINNGVAVYQAVDDGADFIFLDFNPAGLRMEQKTKDEVIGKRVTEAFPGVKEMGLFEVFQRVWRTGRPENHPLSFYRDQHLTGWRENYVYRLPTGEVVSIYEDLTVIKKAEEELRENEEKYRLVFEAANVGKSMTLPGGQVQANQAFCGMLGYSCEEMKTKKWQDITPPEDIDKTQKIVDSIIKGEKDTVRFEKRYLRKDGTIIWGDVSVAARRNSAGKLLNFITTVVDITERKRAEEENIRLLELLDNASNSVTIHDMKGRFLYANKITYEMLGYTREEFMAMDLSKVDAPESAELIASRMNKLVANGEAEFDVNHLKKDGTKIPMMVSAKMSKWNGQEVFLSIAVNITERKKAEAALAKTRALLTESQEMAKIGGWEFDVETMKQIWTEETFRILEIDLTKGEPKVPEGIDFIAPEYRDLAQKAIQKAIEHGEPYDQEWEVITVKGNRRWVRAIAKVNRENGKTKSVSGSFQDITERKRAEEALRESRQILRLVLDTIPVRVFWKDVDSNYLGCNLPFAIDSGLLLPDELMGKNDWAMGWKEQAEAYRADDRYVMDSGYPKLNYEEPQTTPDGQRIWLRTSKIPLFDANNKIKGILGTYEDITERKQTEEKIQASETRYRRLFESAKDGILILNADTGIIEDANPFIKELLGYPREELIGKELWEIGLFKDIVASRESFLELKKKEYVRYEDLPLESKDGHKKDVEFVSNVYLVGDHNVVQCNIRDITERVKTSEKLNEQLAELQRWQSTMLDREDRVMELKKEINQLLEKLGQPKRYG